MAEPDASSAGKSCSLDRDSSLSMPPYVDEKVSYIFGRSLQELQHCTLAPMIESKAKLEPDSMALVVYDEGVSKSHEQLNAEINRLVNGMVNHLDLKHGDKVGLFSYTSYQFLLVQFACNKLGLALNPINPSYKCHEFSYVLCKSDVKVVFMPGRNSKQSALNEHWSIICDPSISDLQREGSLECLKHIVIIDGEFDEKELKLKDVKLSRWPSVFTNDHQLDSTAQNRVDQVCPDDIYGVYYTSGTTGFPKGAAITQFNAINNARLAHKRLYQQRGPNLTSMRPNVCLPLPLFHEFAGLLGVLVPFVHGGSFVFPGMRYNIQSVVESIMQFKCNAIFLTPTILMDLLGYVEKNAITNVPLRSILCAGAPVVAELVSKTQRTLPDLEEFRIAYGSSENGVIATLQTGQESADTRAFTVGSPLDFTEIRVADTKTGDTALLGCPGEVQTRGFNIMRGYYNEPEKTNEVITRSRWYKTGDLGIIERHGSLQVIGRIKDLIIKGGANIYPAEVETVLHKHDAIEDAQVFGVPDERYGEEICAWIKLDLSKGANIDEATMKEDVTEFCKKRLAYYKIPKYLMFVREFPMTPLKKVKKFEMRALTTKILNLG